jgi:hypothetical protein
VIPALTVRQPFAGLIVAGTKRIENRSRPTSVRGRVLIHAAKLMHQGIRTEEFPEPFPWPPSLLALPRSAVLGAVNVIGCHNAETCADRCIDAGGIRAADAERNGMGKIFHWELDHAVAFATEIPRVNGQVTWWHPDARVQHLAELALAEARRA